MQSISTQCKNITYSKERGRNTTDIAKEKRYLLRIQKPIRPSYNMQPYRTTA